MSDTVGRRKDQGSLGTLASEQQPASGNNNSIQQQTVTTGQLDQPGWPANSGTRMFHLSNHVVGLDDRVKEIQTKIQPADKRTAWRCAWLHGQAGIGKTTLARALFDHLSGGFHLTAAVEFQQGKKGDHQLKDHMSQVLQSLRGSAGPTSSTSLIELARELEEFVKSKKVLLLLDNVWAVRQLELFLPGEFGEGSVVVVTSRSGGFDTSSAWQKMRSSLYVHQVKPLREAEAMELLQLTAGMVRPDAHTAKAMKEIWTACDGMPVPLKMIGERIWRKDLETWQELDLSDRTTMTELPPRLGALTRLRALDLSGCTSLSSLPESTTKLVSLEDLNLSGCTSMRAPFPEVLWGRLKRLDLSRCSSLTRLPGRTTGGDVCLEKLNLSGCSLLEVADCSNCLQLQEISLQGCSSLRVLDLRRCASLSSSVDGVQAVHVSALQEVNLSGMNITSIPPFLSELPNLQTLVVEDCNELHAVELRACQSLANASFSGCSRLQDIILRDCTALVHLGELVGSGQLLGLDLSGCSKLPRLPPSLVELRRLERLELSGCESLTHLPAYMETMASLQTVGLASCNKLVSLPHKIGNNVKSIDLCNCQEMYALAGSLIKLRPWLLKSGTQLKLDGWDELLSENGSGQGQREQPEGGSGQQDTQNRSRRSTRTTTRSTLQMLSYACNIRCLLDNHAMILDQLGRLSWVEALLGAATFIAALTPPGGYDNGVLFLDYSNGDCPANSNSTNIATSTACSTLSALTNCTSFTNSASSCIRAADQCTDNVDCTVKPSAFYLRRFYFNDLVAFGICMGVVMGNFLCSIPHSAGLHPSQTACMIWLSLVSAALLFSWSVAWVMFALFNGVLSVYPSSMMAADVLVSFFTVMFMVAAMFLLILWRLMSLYPGRRAWSGRG